jgi:RNA polymerase sigma-70 factor (sigma-E family)
VHVVYAGGWQVSEPVGFRDFVAARSAALLRSAWLLTGDMATAQDLVRAALVKSRRRWPRLAREDAPETYVRQVMLSTFLTQRRRRWRDGFPAAGPPGRPEPRGVAVEADIPQAVSQALRTLPPRQRAAVVLQFFDDLTEAQVAHILGCSVGTVRSQTAMALSRLRECL